MGYDTFESALCLVKDYASLAISLTDPRTLDKSRSFPEPWFPSL